jgi:hypothetical protein
MATATLFLCSASLLSLASCGEANRAGRGARDEPGVEHSTGPFSWLPEGEGERPDRVEEVHETEASWVEAWARRRDARAPAPRVDFATHRVVVVAQHAKHGGYRGARLVSVRREGGRAVVEYEAKEPAPGALHAMVYKGYLGFFAAVPREAGTPLFRRVPPS